MQTADFYSSATGTLRVNGGRDENAPQGVSLSIDDLSYIKQGSRANEAEPVTDYDLLDNKPQINNITLTGNKSLNDLGIQPKIDSSHKVSADNIDDTETTNKFATAAQLAQITTNQNNISSITDITKQQTTSLYFGTNAGANSTEASSGDNGKYNCAVGTRAMQSNTQGDHCTALGFQAMYKNTTGDGNTAIGEDALYENTTGTSNTVVGAHALQNCTGSGNVAIGTSSLQNDTTGFYNVAVGQDAGKGVTVGQKNIFIGANCKANSDISNSIFIGADIVSATSNLCVIGNSSITKTIVRGDFVVRDTQGTRRQLVFNQDGTVSWIEVQ